MAGRDSRWAARGQVTGGRAARASAPCGSAAGAPALRRGVTLLGAVVLLVGLAAGPALASCVPPPPKDQAIAQAEAAFVGTVEAVTNDGYWATVRVEEVWKGGDLPPAVEVRGGEAAGGPRSSVDRAFAAGVKYLFVPLNDRPVFQDNACSATEEWREEFAQYRPDDARKPVRAQGGDPAPVPEESTPPSEVIGGRSDADEPMMMGGDTGTVTSDDRPGADDPDSAVHEAGDNTVVPEVDAEPVSAGRSGEAALLWVAALIVAVVVLAAVGWSRRARA